MTTDSDIDTETGAAALLADYAAGSSFFFASPRGSMLARGVDATVPKTSCVAGRDGLPGRVA